MMRLFCWLFYGHRSVVWIRNIYGDEMGRTAGKRSLWRCQLCGARVYRSELIGEEGA
jgi:hypothetical protein